MNDLKVPEIDFQKAREYIESTDLEKLATYCILPMQPAVNALRAYVHYVQELEDAIGRKIDELKRAKKDQKENENLKNSILRFTSDPELKKFYQDRKSKALTRIERDKYEIEFIEKILNEFDK